MGDEICVAMPIVLALLYVAIRFAIGGALSAGAGPVYRPAPGEGLRVLGIDRKKQTVRIYHPEGGTWSYGMTQDLACTWGIESVTALGGYTYDIQFNRNPENGARVLEAAYTYRTSPKPVSADGSVHLWEIPGYNTLFEESERNLD